MAYVKIKIYKRERMASMTVRGLSRIVLKEGMQRLVMCYYNKREEKIDYKSN